MPRGRKKKVKLDVNIKPATIKSVVALVLILTGLLCLISFFAPDYSFNQKLQGVLLGLFGLPSIIVPFLLGLVGLLFLDSVKTKLKEPRSFFGLALLLVTLSGFAQILAKNGNGAGSGGFVGTKLATFLISSLSIYGGILVLVVLLGVSLVVLFDLSIDQIFNFISAHKPTISVPKLKHPLVAATREASITVSAGNTSMQEETSQLPFSPPSEDTFHGASFVTSAEDLEPSIEIIPSPSEPQGRKHELETTHLTNINMPVKPDFDFTDKIWKNPPLDILVEPPLEVVDSSDSDLRAKIIRDTLRSFGIDVDVVDIKVGSSVTQYSLQPKSVTKVSKIASLHENLALALASPTGSVRIEAPIPGKSWIGIEVPNSTRTFVYFKSLINSDPMKALKSKIGIVLGKDVAGRTYVYDIAKMPHMLIAGATGSGKSFFIHNILFSILFRASPQEVKFIMVDPKRVEFTHYQDIPHLLTPVVTDMEKAPSVFRWAVSEMERRYKLFEQAKARNIESYNEKSGFQALPYIVIVVDELAEIMVQDPAGVEKSIIRLAQLARATGIHLVMAVQRPSTNIITGLIKANITCRAAFNVTSQVDSRVIIDQPGAEKLLGKGDMLFVPPDVQKPVRLQGAFISDKEIANLVTFLKSQGVAPDYKQEVLQMTSDRPQRGNGASSWGEDVGDDLFDEAVEIVVSSGKASASLLQRKLSIGYARAARIIDLMEEKGIIGGAAGGSKARDILMDNRPAGMPSTEFDAESDDLSSLM